MSEHFKRIVKIVLPIIVTAVFLGSLYFLFSSIRHIHYRDVVAHLRSYPRTIVFLALVGTALNYLVLTLYDVLALEYVGKRLAYRKVAFTSFLSYVFSYNIGLSVFGSGAIRLRFYSSWGIDPASIAKIIGSCALTFWLGLATMGGLSLLFAPPAIFASWRLIGIIPLSLVAAYLWLSGISHSGFKLKSVTIKLPRERVAIAQVIVSSLDWVFAAFVLYVLLPPGIIKFPAFVAIYVLAQFAGASSHIPGGVGVFESVLLASLSTVTPSSALVGSLLAYRAIYYLIPLATAVVTFVIRELWEARKKIAGVAATTRRIMAPFAPTVLSIIITAAGAILLFSGAVPAASGRLKVLEPLEPLALLELSHLLASIAGVGLLVVADGIRRRIDAAYWFALGLLGIGAILSLAKGLDWEEALAMSLSAALLFPFRHLFVRRAAILSRSASHWSVAVMGVVITVSLWITIFASKHVPYSSDTLLVFELSKEAPRSLRAGVGIAIAVVVLGLRILLTPAPKRPQKIPANSDFDVRRILSTSTRSVANLALLGDKYLRFGPTKESFLMYGLSGGTFVIMGDPIGDPAEFPTLVWDFYEEARRQGARVVWYEIGSDSLPLLAELGFRFFKIGEEAIVDLKSFTLEGNRGKRLRPPLNKMRKDGYSFSVIPVGSSESRMIEFRTLSDSWLKTKESKEKGFSLGFFDEDYLANFPIAVVEKDGRAIAFTNLWPSGDGKELSIDIMRHADEAPNGTMEYLFIEILSWATTHGFERFNLGMAPLSGVESRDAAPLWNKAVSLIFRNGEGIYNFQGLRNFKNKFFPDWIPRYVAVSGGASLLLIAADIAFLVSQGKRLPKVAVEVKNVKK